MLQNLTGMLFRFRMNPIALVADIEKAFLQIGLQEEICHQVLLAERQRYTRHTKQYPDIPFLQGTIWHYM